MTRAQLTVPTDWDDITSEWMTAAIGGRHPDAEIDAVTVGLRDDGTNRRARLDLSYAKGSGPATVFAKAADPAHVALHKLTSGLFHEPLLFDSGVALPVDCPAVYAALIDTAGDNFCLIMEDLDDWRALGKDSPQLDRRPRRPSNRSPAPHRRRLPR